MAMYGALARFIGPAALAYGIKESVTSFADMERQMTRIGITAGANAEQTNAAFASMQKQATDMALPIDQAVKALDTLVSSGMSLKEAMDFLPAVLATAQASGADTADIANTAIKAASALKLEAGEMQKAFDIMVAGGKAGQFELKDMAQYIPELSNSFASLGYEGEEGLKKLIAMMQTVREDTGSAESAATNLQNIFGKIYSEDTASKFKKMGVDLNAEMAKAKKNGEDTVAAFVRISNEAIKGDLTKLPKLFTDQQFRLGMQSLMTSADSYQKFLKAVNDTKVDGTVFRDLKRVTDDTQASIDRLSNSWDNLMRSVGKQASGVLAPAMDRVTKFLGDRDAYNAGMDNLSSDPALLANQQQEFFRRAIQEKVAQSPREQFAAWEEAVRSFARGQVKNPLDWIGQESLKKDSKGALRRDYSLYRRGMGPENALDAKPADGSIPLPYSAPDKMILAYQEAQNSGRELIAKIAKQYADEAAANQFYGTEKTPPEVLAHMEKMKKRFPNRYKDIVNPEALGTSRVVDVDNNLKRAALSDRRRNAMQDARDQVPQKRFSLLDAMRMDTGKYVDKESDVSRAARAEMSDMTTSFEQGGKMAADTIKAGAADSGKALGDEASSRLKSEANTIGQILGQAAAQAIKASVGNLSVNVNGANAPTRVNADVGKTNTFVAGPKGMGAK